MLVGMHSAVIMLKFKKMLRIYGITNTRGPEILRDRYEMNNYFFFFKEWKCGPGIFFCSGIAVVLRLRYSSMGNILKYSVRSTSILG